MINIDLINCEDMLVAAKLVSRQGRIGTIMMLTVLLTLVCTQKLTDLTLNEPIKLELKPGATVIYKLMLPTLKDNE